VKYLTLIRSIALLHQHQRPVKTATHNGKTVEYIEVTLDDIAVANRLAHEVLGRSLDELPPQTRRLLLLVDEMVTKQCELLKMEKKEYLFSRRDVRQYTGFAATRNCGCTCIAWKNSNICWRTVAAGARASSMSWCLSGAATMTSPSCPD
jgi:hypothetical protein